MITIDSKLAQHADTLQTTQLLDLFSQDPQRAQTHTVAMDELWLDYSKNHIDKTVLALLCQLAEAKQLPQAIQRLLAGEHVNNTENRAAWHTALRQADDPTEAQVIKAALDKMGDFVDRVHSGAWRGFTGKAINTVVNIGIGGSDLGPRMAVQALAGFTRNVALKFVANVDGADLCDTLADIDPETTLFIVASKTFTTLETLNNGLSARQWMLDAGCAQQHLAQHFVAISSNVQAAGDFGIAEDNIFPMWDWVGGRYSLWSAIGLPIALAVGMDNFRDLLKGAASMDRHFSEAPLQQNMPVIAALISYWYSHFWGASTHAVLAYAQRMSRLPAYLQQLDMESLGKSVTRAGDAVDYPTGSVIWGTEGTNGQHSFHQLLHQGTQLIPLDFIAIKQPMSSLEDQHQHLLACCISQSQALLQGKTLAQAQAELQQQGLTEAEVQRLAPHKVIAGNRPSNTLILERLNPKNLGALIAFYEHKVYTTAVLLDINPFDQWGVELGKQLGKPIYQALSQGNIDPAWDGSTQALIAKLRA
ncbi:MAG: glucose-6-phosphate isomerase [Cellvibrionaceae bacterium]|nr:glucose-6-phosphate isomerase [Cellvibrionaceae bacterium]